MMEALEPRELRRRIDAGEELQLLDVRESEEWSTCRIEGSTWIPLGELSVRHVELDPDRPLVIVCHHGIRSAHAAVALVGLGFDEVFNLTGGIDRWSRDVDPALPRY